MSGGGLQENLRQRIGAGLRCVADEIDVAGAADICRTDRSKALQHGMTDIVIPVQVDLGASFRVKLLQQFTAIRHGYELPGIPLQRRRRYIRQIPGPIANAGILRVLRLGDRLVLDGRTVGCGLCNSEASAHSAIFGDQISFNRCDTPDLTRDHPRGHEDNGSAETVTNQDRILTADLLHLTGQCFRRTRNRIAIDGIGPAFAKAGKVDRYDAVVAGKRSLLKRRAKEAFEDPSPWIQKTVFSDIAFR